MTVTSPVREWTCDACGATVTMGHIGCPADWVSVTVRPLGLGERVEKHLCRSCAGRLEEFLTTV